MKQDLTLRRLSIAAAATSVLMLAFAQSSSQSLDVGSKPADDASAKDGLFPEDACKEPGLDVFADVLRGKMGSNRQIRVVGHADVSGTPEANQALSLKRAESVRRYLIQKGADPAMLLIVDLGSKDPANPANPNAAENRHVVIERDMP